MANEVLLSGVDSKAAEVLVQGSFVEKAADRGLLPNHPALVYIPVPAGVGSNSIQISSLGIMGYDPLAAAGENATLTNTVFSDDAVNITPARVAKKLVVSDLVIMTGADGGYFGDPIKMGQEAAISAALYVKEKICDLVATFSAGVGTTNVALTLDAIFEASRKLRNNGVVGPYFCILHPDQWADLELDMRSEGIQRETIETFVSSAGVIGWMGRYLGIDFFVTKEVASANSDVDWKGGIFGKGAIAWSDMETPNGYRAPETQINLGRARVLFDHNASTGMVDVVFESYPGAAVVQQACGVSILSKQR